MKLIDKDALVAEIKKHLEYANNGILCAQTGIEKGLKKYERDLNAWQHCQNMCKNILSFIDSLEVKEVDEQKERMSECPYRQVGCTMYEGKIIECNGACSWVVDYPRLKELKV